MAPKVFVEPAQSDRSLRKHGCAGCLSAAVGKLPRDARGPRRRDWPDPGRLEMRVRPKKYRARWPSAAPRQAILTRGNVFVILLLTPAKRSEIYSRTGAPDVDRRFRQKRLH